MIKTRIGCPHCGKPVNFEVFVEKPLRRLRGPTNGGRPRAFLDTDLLALYPPLGGVPIRKDKIMEVGREKLRCCGRTVMEGVYRLRVAKMLQPDKNEGGFTRSALGQEALDKLSAAPDDEAVETVPAREIEEEV